MDLLAHSAQGHVPEQSYREHILAVNRHAKQYSAAATRFFSGQNGERAAFLKAVDEGSLFHDLGKVDARNQVVLNDLGSREKLPLNHCDGGTALLWGSKAVNGAFLSYCHHAGLFSLSEELAKPDKLAFRDVEIAADVDVRLDEYLEGHSQAVGTEAYGPTGDSLPLKGLPLRLALSCLVDADHHDTAQHYGQEPDVVPCSARWQERLDALDHYVEGLKQGLQDTRNGLRNEIYAACRGASTEPAIRCCDAPVGSGKTTAVMAHLLKAAESKKLRHIFVVLPYTNIIRQSVDIYRQALVLPSEEPEEVVAAHYHQAEFSGLSSRHLSVLWRSPIIVTSAVQFFETLAGANPSKLRKLHALPGSAVFVDESHAAMPMHIWPQQWQWLNELVSNWGCHFVLASGSLVRFWEFDGFSGDATSVPNILPSRLQDQTKAFEAQRVTYPKRTQPMNREELISSVVWTPGPRLVILNTVQSAAVIAHELKDADHDVLHLSTALAPIDRERIIARVHQRLASEQDIDWILVATSCVEAGVDFSFKTAFRESATLTSLIQTGGRANRHGKDDGCDVVDFRVRDSLLNKHPAFDVSRTVLDQMSDEGLLQELSPTELASESVRRELSKGDVQRRSETIRKLEKRQDYREVARLCRVIDADTRIVVVTPSIVEKLWNREVVGMLELLRNSVQLWSNKIAQLDLIPFDHYDEIYSLGSYEYDSEFLGYMKGILPLIYQQEKGLII